MLFRARLSRRPNQRNELRWHPLLSAMASQRNGPNSGGSLNGNGIAFQNLPFIVCTIFPTGVTPIVTVESGTLCGSRVQPDDPLRSDQPDAVWFLRNLPCARRHHADVQSSRSASAGEHHRARHRHHRRACAELPIDRSPALRVLRLQQEASSTLGECCLNQSALSEVTCLRRSQDA